MVKNVCLRVIPFCALALFLSGEDDGRFVSGFSEKRLSGSNGSTALKTEKELRRLGLISETNDKNVPDKNHHKIPGKEPKNIKSIVSKKIPVLILPHYDSSAPLRIAEASYAALAEAVSLNGRFIAVDRKSVDAAFKQFEISESGLVSENDRLRLGRFVGASVILEATIEDYRRYMKNDLHVVSYVFKIKRRNIGSGDVSGRERANIKTFGTSEAAAVDAAAAQTRVKARFLVKEMFPLMTYVVSTHKRDVMIRFGQDLGLKPGMRFKVYPKSLRRGERHAVADVIVREVSPELSLCEVRIAKMNLLKGMPVREWNLHGWKAAFAGGISQVSLDPGGFTRLQTYFDVKNGTNDSGFEPLTEWITLTDRLSLKAVKAMPYLSFEINKDFIETDLVIKTAFLFSAKNIYGLKLLSGVRNVFVDYNKLYLSYNLLLGGVGIFFPLGKIKADYYIPADGEFIRHPVNKKNKNTYIHMFGLSYGAEVSFSAGYNFDFDKKIVIEGGYGLFKPIDRYFVMALDDHDEPALLSSLFDTSAASPSDLSGWFFGLRVEYLF